MGFNIGRSLRGIGHAVGNLAGQVGVSLIGNAIGGHNARKNARESQELSDESWRMRQSNAIQLTQEDMRNANLNPILAVSQGATSGVGSASPNVDSGPTATDLMNARIASQQLKIDRYNAETQRMAQMTNEKSVNSAIALNQAKTNESEQNANYIKETTKTIAPQIENIKATTEKSRQEVKNLQLQWYEIAAKIQATIQDIENGKQITMATVNNLNASAYHFFEKADEARKHGALLDEQKLEVALRNTDPEMLRKRSTNNWLKDLTDPNNNDPSSAFYKGAHYFVNAVGNLIGSGIGPTLRYIK